MLRFCIQLTITNACGLPVVARGPQQTAREFSDPYGLRVAPLSGSCVVPDDPLVRGQVFDHQLFVFMRFLARPLRDQWFMRPRALNKAAHGSNVVPKWKRRKVRWDRARRKYLANRVRESKRNWDAVPVDARVVVELCER